MSNENFYWLFRIGIWYGIFKALRFLYGYFTISSAVSALSRALNDSGAEAFRGFVMNTAIPNYPVMYNSLRAGWEMVKGSRNISREMKESVRVALQSRGVIVR